MIIIVILVFVLLIWFGGFIYSNDFFVQTKSLHSLGVKKVMVIFPHADDEALSMGGLFSIFTRDRIDVRWVILTKGEKGTPDGHADDKLKQMRVEEALCAGKIYGVQKILQADFPDGGLDKNDKKLKQYIEKAIDEYHPDLVLTYDLSGLYGHPDHIAVSEIVTDSVKQKSDMKLWYVSFPKRILDTITLPVHMAKDFEFSKRRVTPTHKAWVGFGGILNKIRVSYIYKSQDMASSKNMPIKFIPMWFYISLTPYEYFYEGTK